jgi:predicted nuclease with TOPRIM domain
MASQSLEEFQKEFNTVRNKQVEMFDRLGQLESQMSQLVERTRRLEDLVAGLESNAPKRQPYQR